MRMFIYSLTHAYTKLILIVSANGTLKDVQPQKKQNDCFRWWKSCTTSLVIMLIVILISILAAKSELESGMFVRVSCST